MMKRSSYCHIVIKPGHHTSATLLWGKGTWRGTPILAATDEAGRIHYLTFAKGKATLPRLWQHQNQATAFERDDHRIARTLTAKKLSLVMAGTDFQISVWRELLKIPSGQTISYAELAQRIGKPKAVRAVGTACGANPVPLLVPCHRVVASDGGLGGFSGGLAVKKKLLRMESSAAAMKKKKA